ncbi:tyrosine-type recombinase/integrase [Methylobacterium isbiliense]|uniref:tyrosine-type recombinase/integrase n=1 Tax=Methylobacterium isbiliense TaxID=315478 RepID=UPI001EE2225D|nr:tyrosine-type recombinase/integrase [Methylobacterium isbiliense]MDN3627141.1 tyrosine-type recombinase/integrase [Methylobacterium isbiliense]
MVGRLADGSRRTYYYAWRGGPRITAEPGSPEFQLAYAEAVKSRKAVPAGTMFALIAEFRASAEFTGKSESSKRAYRTYLRMIEEEFGDMPIEAVEDPEARGEFKRWRDTMATTPRKADYAWTVLARVLSVAKDRGRIRTNVCERGGRLYRADRRDALWSEDHITRFGAVASDELWLALVLALWTGQRQGDLLTVPWSAYLSGGLRFAQGKTGARVVVPIGETLRAALEGAPRRSRTILTNQRGEPWTSDGFRTSWRKACDKAQIHDVTFHDLRGSAVVHLALAGCAVPEIAAITGHSLKDAEAILHRHYLGRDIRLAETAMRKREESERSREAVKRPCKTAARVRDAEEPK